MFRLSNRSINRLEGVNNDLARVVQRAIEITPLDFGVTEGIRTKQRQQKLFDSGASKTLNSRHLTGHAVDLVVYFEGDVSWHMGHYEIIANAMKEAASEQGINIEWGGDWKSFRDGPHFQLSRKEYPA